MEVQQLLKELSKKGSADHNLKSACEVALVHLSSLSTNAPASSSNRGTQNNSSTPSTSTKHQQQQQNVTNQQRMIADEFGYPFAEVLKAFCIALQSRVDKVFGLGLEGLMQVVAVASCNALADVCFVLNWPTVDTNTSGGGAGGGNNGNNTNGGGANTNGSSNHNNNRHTDGTNGLDEALVDNAMNDSDDEDGDGGYSLDKAKVQLQSHLAKAFHHMAITRPLTDTTNLLKVIHLLLNIVSKGMEQLLPTGEILMAHIVEPLLSLHSALANPTYNGGGGSGGGSTTSSAALMVTDIRRLSYHLLSLIATDNILARFMRDAIPLDWEFFEPFTCAAATINPLEECAPDDGYEPISIPARCRPFFNENASGGFSLREPSRVTANFPTSFFEFKALLSILCRRAAATVSTSLSDEAKVVATTRRGAALRLLIDIFTELPIANANEEHPCASWLALSLEPMLLMPCISKNVPTRAFYEEAIHLFALVSLKVHFHMGHELHGYLTGVLIPLALSQLSSYEQKVAIVRCVRNAFLAHPKALIAIFINYDCSMDMIDKRKGVAMGYLSALIPFMSTLMFTQFTLLSPDQTLLLRQECVESMAAFMRSMLAWASEEVAEEDVTTVGGMCSSGAAADNADNTTSPPANALVLDPKMPPMAYHWKHIHHLMQNKLLLQESRAINMDGGIKKWLAYASEHGFFTSMHPAVIAKFLHTDAPVVVADEVKHSIANSLLKAQLHEDIMAELLALRSMRGVPLDTAFRDFVCDVLHPEGMPADKQMPESQAWGKLQTLFGNEYAKQNADSEVRLTAYAADALAGSILFLHSATHNANSVMRFTCQDWIDLTVESMGMVVARSYLEPIYLRTVATPWGTLQTITGGGGGGGGCLGSHRR